MKLYTLVVHLNILLLSKVVHAKDISAANNASDIGFEGILSKLNVLFQLSPDNSRTKTENKYREDIHLSFPRLVKKYGYSVEEYEVKTSDGYLLTMFRIPKNAPAVLVINGGAASSDEYVTIGRQAGLAYQLADAGYDVWLGNCRGSKYSLRHATLSTSSAAYWNFSWDEMGRYDMPALIDFILKATNVKDLKLIGFSQSTSVCLVLCSEKPEYNDKVSVMILMSPTIFLRHTNLFWAKFLAGPLSPNFYLLLKSIGVYSLFTDREIGPIVSLYKNIFCGTPETADVFCGIPLSIMFGQDHNQINTTSLPVIFGHFPSSLSTRQLQHDLQLIKSGKFRQYDWGKDLNYLKYRSSHPPEYPLENVTTKVAIFWANNDWVCVKEDLQIILGKLPNVIDVYKVPLSEFNHADFIFAKDVKSLCYEKVIELLKSN